MWLDSWGGAWNLNLGCISPQNTHTAEQGGSPPHHHPHFNQYHIKNRLSLVSVIEFFSFGASERVKHSGTWEKCLQDPDTVCLCCPHKKAGPSGSQRFISGDRDRGSVWREKAGGKKAKRNLIKRGGKKDIVYKNSFIRMGWGTPPRPFFSRWKQKLANKKKKKSKKLRHSGAHWSVGIWTAGQNNNTDYKHTRVRVCECVWVESLSYSQQ